MFFKRCIGAGKEISTSVAAGGSSADILVRPYIQHYFNWRITVHIVHPSYLVLRAIVDLPLPTILEVSVSLSSK